MQRVGLYDLDEMILRCHGISAKEYINEAVMAYRVGAYRSCIIATWIAVYFDLVDKLRVHANSGVQEAKDWIRTYDEAAEKYEPAKYNTAAPLVKKELDILDKCARADIGIISKVERHDLYRLRDDRNRCAHPTVINEVDKFVPSAELARTHLRSAIESVLSKRAVPGRLASERILNHCRTEYFASNTDDAFKELSAHYHQDIDADVARQVSAGLLDDVFEVDRLPSDRRQRVAAVDAIHQINKDATASAWRNKIRELATISDPEVWKIAIHLLSRFSWAWESLEEPQRSWMERVVRQVDAANGFGANIIVQALTTEPLTAAGSMRLGDLPLPTLALYLDRLPKEIMKRELLERVGTSNNWRSSTALFILLMNQSDLLKDDAYATAFMDSASHNDQVFTAPKFNEVVKQIITNRASDVLSEELRNAIQRVITAMSEDQRVSSSEFESLMNMADILVDFRTHGEDQI